MKVVKEGTCNNKKYRIICKSFYIDEYESVDSKIIWVEYKVQIKVLCFWITIKTFETFDFSSIYYNYFEDRPIELLEAEELFDAIINPYKII